MSHPIIDSTLIEARRELHALPFAFWVLLTILGLSTAWGWRLEDFVALKAPFSFTTTESNVALIAKALHVRKAKVAIAGSSLSSRLDPRLFPNVDDVMNLSVGGGSVMTGLEVLSAAPWIPENILAEINILDRVADGEVRDKGICAASFGPLAMFCGVHPPLRYLLSRPSFSYVSSDQQAAWRSTRRSNLSSQAPAAYDTEAMVSQGRLMWDQRNDWKIADQNFKRIQELIRVFEARGSRVYLLYLPYVDGYDTHDYARRNRQIAGGNDSFDCPRCIDVRRLVDVGQLRWADGAHLDDKSALIVAEALARRLLQ